MKKSITLLLLLSGLSLKAQKTDTIKVGDRFRLFDQLEMGTTRDAIYTELNGKAQSVTLKTKTVERITIDGREYMAFTHLWDSSNPDLSGSFYYICEPETLRPVIHIRNSKRMGKEAFAFSKEKISGLDSVQNNARKDFNLPLDMQTYNWEIDLETYSLIPMKAGYQVAMPFYHPGSPSVPKYYLLKVEGSEKLKMPNGQVLDCWIIFTDYGGTQPTRFWYTKKGQNFVKMEGQYNQLKIHKVRLFD